MTPLYFIEFPRQYCSVLRHKKAKRRGARGRVRSVRWWSYRSPMTEDEYTFARKVAEAVAREGATNEWNMAESARRSANRGRL
jgi:hypothetical protein